MANDAPELDAPHLWDLESELSAEDAAADEETAKEIRLIDRARVVLSERLRGARGLDVRCRTVDGEVIAGTISAVHEDVIVLTGRYLWIVPLSAVAEIAGIGTARAVPASGRERGSGRTMLLELFDVPVLVGRISGGVSAGVLGEVGRDYVAVADTPATTSLISWSAIAWVRAQS